MGCLTFLEEWWSCKQTQPFLQGSRQEAAGIQPSQSSCHDHNSHKTEQNTADSPAKTRARQLEQQPTITTEQQQQNNKERFESCP